MTQPTHESDATIDTRLRSFDELMTRLIVPIPTGLIDTKKDDSRANYVPITTMKDWLDWVCGRGRWKVKIKKIMPRIETLYTKRGKEPEAGALFGMIVKLSIKTSDEGWISQDGTGTERLTGTPIYGDPLTNAYAQAVRRAAESFGTCRELWRKKLISAQLRAKQIVTAPQELPKAPAEEEADEADEYTHTSAAPEVAAPAATPAQIGAHTLSVKELKNLHKAGGPKATPGLIDTLRQLYQNKRGDNFDTFCRTRLGIEPSDLTRQVCTTMTKALTEPEEKR